ncbi:MAG: peptidoglycan-binding protein [Eggerthellaceae bacterium]|nr:peptidoglycan-binding protein [Eggerthellaceae bacterium]
MTDISTAVKLPSVVRLHERGAAVEDVQQRLVRLGYLDISGVDGAFEGLTLRALERFCADNGLPKPTEVNDKVWSALVDASFSLGDRTLFLRMPYFHGHDVYELQQALCALGFSTYEIDGIFGVHTELALRRFQENMGLPNDGIAGAYTFAAIHNLHHSWEGKTAVRAPETSGFARMAAVLEKNAICLFGTCEFTREVAKRMSNLSLATSPISRIVSADALLVAPSDDMLRVRIVLDGAQETKANVPLVSYDPDDTLSLRMGFALQKVRAEADKRMAIKLPGNSWFGAGLERSAQHYAITILDALCAALS